MRGYILVYSWLQERTCDSSGSQQRGLNFFVRGTPKRAEENRMLWGKSKLFKHPQVTSFTLRSFRQTKRNPTTSRTSHLTRHSFRLLGDAFYSRSATASQPIRKTVSLCLWDEEAVEQTGSRINGGHKREQLAHDFPQWVSPGSAVRTVAKQQGCV